uniref:Putative secreted protein n=1 Tax=Anopheles darlingi TaxID=43151 RepID=A0A2M4DRD4_ANODA
MPLVLLPVLIVYTIQVNGGCASNKADRRARITFTIRCSVTVVCAYRRTVANLFLLLFVVQQPEAKPTISVSAPMFVLTSF